METIKQIDATALGEWMRSGKEISILDIRPVEERKEWYIPGSIHTDAYERLRQNDPSALDGISLGKNQPVVTVCAGGKTSLIAADILQNQGYEVYSLQDGMKGWSLAWNKAVLDFRNFKVVQIRRTGKGCLSYIIASNNEALIVDASSPVEVYAQILEEQNWRLVAVMETHIHADHLSRSKQVAERFGVPLKLPMPNKVTFPHESIRDGQEFQLGQLTLKAISTPGHTIESMCFLANDEVLISGDTVFTDAVGRPDLKANEEEAKRRASLLYDSLQKIIQLKETMIVLPAHTNKPVEFDNEPIAAALSGIKKQVSLLHLEKGDFVNRIIDQLPPAPANYLTIVEKNLSGNFTDVNPIDLEAGANRCAVI